MVEEDNKKALSPDAIFEKYFLCKYSSPQEEGKIKNKIDCYQAKYKEELVEGRWRKE